MSGRSSNGRGRSKYADPRGHQIRIYRDIYNSAAFLALSFSARCLYLDIRLQLRLDNNGNLAVTLSALEKRRWRSSATIAKGLRELLAVGLIRKTRQGGLTAGKKFCCLYAVTDESVKGFPGLGIPPSKATHDHLQFKTVEDAKKAIREAPRTGARRKSRVQKVALVGSQSEPKIHKGGSEFSYAFDGTFTKCGQLGDESLPFL